MRILDTHWPTAVAQPGNNSNYLKLFKGSNCLGNIIEVVANVMLFLLYCSLWHNYHSGCNVYNHLYLKKEKRKHSNLHLRHLCSKHLICSLFRLIGVLETRHI